MQNFVRFSPERPVGTNWKKLSSRTARVLVSFSGEMSGVRHYQLISEHFYENHVTRWLTVARLWCIKLCAFIFWNTLYISKSISVEVLKLTPKISAMNYMCLYTAIPTRVHIAVSISWTYTFKLSELFASVNGHRFTYPTCYLCCVLYIVTNVRTVADFLLLSCLCCWFMCSFMANKLYFVLYWINK